MLWIRLRWPRRGRQVAVMLMLTRFCSWFCPKCPYEFRHQTCWMLCNACRRWVVRHKFYLCSSERIPWLFLRTRWVSGCGRDWLLPGWKSSPIHCSGKPPSVRRWIECISATATDDVPLDSTFESHRLCSICQCMDRSADGIAHFGISPSTNRNCGVRFFFCWLLYSWITESNTHGHIGCIWKAFWQWNVEAKYAISVVAIAHEYHTKPHWKGKMH